MKLAELDGAPGNSVTQAVMYPTSRSLRICLTRLLCFAR